MKHKFHAQPTFRDGIRFDSKLESAYYDRLVLLRDNSDLLFFLRQVPIHLPGGTKLIIDFVEFWEDGSVVFTDVKGIETPVFKIKRREVEAAYPFTINVVRKV